jgi:hypoxanthine-DNA glycosylase
MRVRGFEAIAAPDARVLVLGTIPGKRSLAAGEYYANPGNAFWFVISRLLDVSLELSYQTRAQLVTRAKVAIWDVLQAAERTGSADSGIVRGSEVPNDFRKFFDRHPRLRAVFFNGKKAEKLYRTLVVPMLGCHATAVALRSLPSTSPANTRLDKEGKLKAWRAVKDQIGDG